MRILGIITNPFSWRDPNAIGGGDIRKVEVFRRWSKIGVQIETIEGGISPSLRYNVNYPVHVVTLPFSKGNIVTDAFNLAVWTVKILHIFLKWKVSKKHFDVVISGSGISYAFYGWLGSKIFKIPQIAIMQCVADYTSSLIDAYKKWRHHRWSIITAFLGALGDRISSIFLSDATAFICISEPIADALRKAGFLSDRIFVTGNGVDLEKVNAVMSELKEYDCIYLGRVEAEKGVPDLLEAWRLVVERNSKAKLIVVGSGSFLAKARQLVEKLCINENVKFTGFIQEEKYSYLKKSKMLAFPSKREEGWGLVIAEAMACGLPVVCYDNSVQLSVFGDIESIVFTPTNNICLLADAMIQLLETEDLLARYGELSRNYAKRYDWDRIAEIELGIVLKVVKRCKN